MNEILKLQKNIREEFESQLIENNIVKGEEDLDHIGDLKDDLSNSLLDKGAEEIFSY